MSVKAAPLLEQSIAIPPPPTPAAEPIIEALVGDWYSLGWHIRLDRRTPPPNQFFWMEWVQRPLRFRVHFGPDYAVDGRVVGHNRIDFANRGFWYKDSPLYAREARIFSQNGEDGVIMSLLDALGVDPASATALEFGVEDGRECNTRLIRERGGRVIQWDRDIAASNHGVHKELVTVDNIPELVARYQVPRELDVLSIDVDYYDFYFWWRISQLVSPRLVVVEYNASWAPDLDLVTLYEGPDKRWDGTRYYGASLLALDRLARRIGYTLVYCDAVGVNAFFVRADLIDQVRELVPRPGDVKSIFRPARFGAGGHPHDPLNRPFTTGAALLGASRPVWAAPG